jgi:hypothetical protein
MPVSYSAFQFSLFRTEKRGKQVDLGASDRDNPIYILPKNRIHPLFEILLALPAAIGFASYNKKNRPIGRWLSIRDCDVARLRPTQREYANLRDRQKLHAIPQTYT